MCVRYCGRGVRLRLDFPLQRCLFPVPARRLFWRTVHLRVPGILSFAETWCDNKQAFAAVRLRFFPESPYAHGGRRN
jgi:hypothetical protein